MSLLVKARDFFKRMTWDRLPSKPLAECGLCTSQGVTAGRTCCDACLHEIGGTLHLPRRAR